MDSTSFLLVQKPHPWTFLGLIPVVKISFHFPIHKERGKSKRAHARNVHLSGRVWGMLFLRTFPFFPKVGRKFLGTDLQSMLYKEATPGAVPWAMGREEIPS
jgi:hypothetical protein